MTTDKNRKREWVRFELNEFLVNKQYRIVSVSFVFNGLVSMAWFYALPVSLREGREREGARVVGSVV